MKNDFELIEYLEYLFNDIIITIGPCITTICNEIDKIVGGVNYEAKKNNKKIF